MAAERSFSKDKISTSPSEDFDPLRDEYIQACQYGDIGDDMSPNSESPCSSMELDRGTLNDMLKYGMTPPQAYYTGIRRKQKEKDRSQKIKVAKRESSINKQYRQQLKAVASAGEMESFTSGSEETLEPEPPPSEGKKRKDSSRNFKTSRKYDRDFKLSSGSISSMDSTTPKQTHGLSVPQVHVDSPNRFRCLNSVPASESRSAGSKELHTPVSQKRQLTNAQVECPQERKDFHRLFSQLINLHLKPKNDKENKLSPLTRQLSAEQEFWRTERSQMIWLELQAWHSGRTIEEEDIALCKSRERVTGILNDILTFQFQRKLKRDEESERNCDCDGVGEKSLDQGICQLSLDDTSPAQSQGNESDERMMFPLESNTTETTPVASEIGASNSASSNQNMTPVTSRLLHGAIEEQKNALFQVTELFDRLDFVHSLYPTMKAVGDEHKIYNSNEFQFRMEVLSVWVNLTKEIGHKLQLMADVLGLSSLEGLEWPWMDLDSPSVTLERIRENLDVMIPEIIDSDEESYEYHTPERTPLRQTPSTPRNQQKMVSFDANVASKGSSGNSTPSGLRSPNDSSTPRRGAPPLFPVTHSSSFTNMDFTSRTSLYRYFVDRNLKKMGLKKLLVRLQDLLDGTLQRAKQVLERPPRVRPSRSLLDLQDEECPTLTALSSSPSLAGTPCRVIPVNNDICCSDFREMSLPSFKPTFLFLIRIPLDVIHECIRLRLEQQPETEPSIHSVKQLIHECKEVLKGGVVVKQYYQQMVQSVNVSCSTDTGDIELDTEDFENDLHRILMVYFDYIQSHITGLQRLPDMTKHLKNFLEEEWNFSKEVCQHVRGGEAFSGKRFCLMTSSLMQSISDFLLDGMDECINQLYDSTLAGEEEDDEPAPPPQILRHGSRAGTERRHAITECCRHIKAHFQDARERATKAIMFAKTLRKDLEIAADFNISTDHGEFLKKLEQTNHMQVIAPHNLSCLMFIPSGIAENRNQILHLLDVTCGREDVPLHVNLEPDGYLLLVKAEAGGVENHRMTNGVPAAAWTGPSIHVEPTAETTIALSHLAVEGLLLVVIHSSQLAEQRNNFKTLLGSTVQLVCEQTSCHQAIAESLTELKSSTMDLRDNLVEAISQVDQKLTMDDQIDMDEKEKPNILKLYQATLHGCYNFGFEYHKEVLRLVSDDLRTRLCHQMVDFAKQWMRFVAEKCERGHGLKPRWATHGLEFLMNVCETSVLATLSNQQFLDLKKEINVCITHVIGDKMVRSGSRRSSSGLGPPHSKFIRNQSCPEPFDPKSRPMSSRTTSSISEPPTPFIQAATDDENTSLGHSSRTSSLSRKDKVSPNRTHVELVEGEDGGIVIDIQKDSNLQLTTPDEEEQVLPIERVRREIQDLEQDITNRLFTKEKIGRVTRVNSDVDYPISIRRVNFQWQRGIKIGQGQFGKVYTAVNIYSGELLAMKQVTFQHNDHKAIKAIADEIRIFEGINHPNLVKYYGVEVHRGEMLIFMEFCTAGTLEDVSKQGLTEPEVRQYTSQLLKAVNVLHENHIVHRDIKGANVFLSVNGPLKLGDFGCSVKLKNYNTMPGEVKSMKGTIAFMAPEVVNEEESDGSGRAADIWSLGCVVIQMITGKRPWHEMENDFMVMFKIGTGGKPHVPDSAVSAEGHDFIQHCHELDPKARWTASQLQDHSFAKVFNEEENMERPKKGKTSRIGRDLDR